MTDETLRLRIARLVRNTQTWSDGPENTFSARISIVIYIAVDFRKNDSTTPFPNQLEFNELHWRASTSIVFGQTHEKFHDWIIFVSATWSRMRACFVIENLFPKFLVNMNKEQWKSLCQGASCSFPTQTGRVDHFQKMEWMWFHTTSPIMFSWS
jgi:hypothetical protein